MRRHLKQLCRKGGNYALTVNFNKRDSREEDVRHFSRLGRYLNLSTSDILLFNWTERGEPFASKANVTKHTQTIRQLDFMTVELDRLVSIFYRF